MSQHNDQRPRPQYGEYADESPQLEQPPTHEPAETAESGAHPGGANSATPALPDGVPNTPAPSGLAPSAGGTTPSRPGPIPGVPHNLGVSGAASSQPATTPATSTPPAASSPPTSASRHGEPYRADETPAAHAASPAPQGVGPGAPARSGAGRGDRIATILLLIVGGYGALQFAFSLMTLGASLTELAVGAFQIEDFVVPSSVNTLGTVGAIVMLSLYALVLVFSIQRMRARKLTFWAPLAAGVLAFVLVIVFYSIALSQSPELLQAGMQPEAMQQMLDYAEAQSL